MTTLRTTVILKTDISGSTARFRALPEAGLRALLAEHRAFLERHAATRDGRIVKPEGDGYWLVFPSVAAAAQAAMAMQEGLRLAQPNRGDDRLAMRIVISLGDVMHEEGALVGDTVVLTARIEAITPPDEIYLSAAAWLAANQAEIRSALVDAFALKGYADPVPVYRIEQTHRTRVIADQYIMVTDLRNFSRIVETAPMATVEKTLEALFELHGRAASEFGGTVRFSVGDSYWLTFADAGLSLAAAERLREGWGEFARTQKLPCPINVAVHQGLVYAFRSYLYGPGMNVAAGVERISARLLGPDEGSIFVTGILRSKLAGTPWEPRLEAVDAASTSPYLAGIRIYRLAQARPEPSPGKP